MHRTGFFCGVVVWLGGWSGLVGAASDIPYNQLERYQVSWETPGRDYKDSMPLGNGDIGLNVWTETNGDLLFYISKMDSWGDNGRLLKVGRIRVTLEPRLVMKPFRQTLKLRTGMIQIDCGQGDDRIELMVWVDANHPVVQVAADSHKPRVLTAQIELWRTERYELPTIEVSDVMMDRSKPDSQHAPTIVEPDTLLSNETDRIGWYHSNIKSIGPKLTLDIQDLAGFPMADPLLDRTFGAVVTAEGGRSRDDRTLTTGPAHKQCLNVFVLTCHPSKPREWLKQMDQTMTAVHAVPFEARLMAHRQWWSEFWERSWIFVENDGSTQLPALMQPNDHPVRVGISQQGGERFAGQIGRISLFKSALGETEIKAMAEDKRAMLQSSDTLLECRTDVPSGTLIDTLRSTDQLSQLTLEAWIRPEKMPTCGGRIIDKTTPGGTDGFLLDSYPGNSLRLITKAATLSAHDLLTPDQWHHVAAVINRASGRVELYHNGRRVAGETSSADEEGFVITRGYILQRFITACAGRGDYPIKFNGSIFTVPAKEAPGDADYRRWGPGYWWQNTRLPYISLCTSGDYDMMMPLFNMYAGEVFELSKYRTKRYFGFDGVYYPECIYFWGAVFSESYGWPPAAQRQDKLQQSGWHKWEWVGGLELVWMMLDYYEHTRDEAFLRDKAIPVASAIISFFDHFYQTGPDGKLIMSPSQALETWWKCTNPMPEVAGLRAMTKRLLQLPQLMATDSQRDQWQRFYDKLPTLPTRCVDGVEILAPAQLFDQKSNIENPELYAVFPFQLVTFAQPTAKLGIEALNHRWDKGNAGWRQDDIFMAYLGLTDQARENLAGRARKSNTSSRFPAFWGPNYDWVPDQDHGGVLMRALQSMLIQTDGKTIWLMPAWPTDWNADFKLHAPDRTTVSGKIRHGKIEDLSVEPKKRLDDVMVCQSRNSKAQ